MNDVLKYHEERISKTMVAALRRAGIARKQALLIAKASLPAIHDALREIVEPPARPFGALPQRAPELYKKTFKARRANYRQQFLSKNGRLVIPLTDEDYTPVRYYLDVWTPLVRSAGVPVTTRYLAAVDSSLFNALDHYIRQSQKHVRGRKPVAFADLGIVTDRQAIKTLLPTPHP